MCQTCAQLPQMKRASTCLPRPKLLRLLARTGRPSVSRLRWHAAGRAAWRHSGSFISNKEPPPANAPPGRYSYNPGHRELRGGAILALVVLLLLPLAIGFMLGYGVREIISRRRRAAAEERFRDELSADTLP